MTIPAKDSGIITRENCLGVWTPILCEWDNGDCFDEGLFLANARKLIDAGIHTLYTTGTDGEFYALKQPEFRRMVETLVRAAQGSSTTIAIGTNGTNTRDILQQIAFCVDAGADCVMPAFPFWLEMNERECRQFLLDCCRAAKTAGVVHYNTFRAKRTVTAMEYASWLSDLPKNFVGTKTAATDFGIWCQLRFETEELVHIPMETVAVPTLMAGGKAFLSATLGVMNPSLAVKLYAFCRSGHWDRAMDLQLKVNRVEHEVCNLLLRAAGYRAGALSKALARLGGAQESHCRMRKPYEGVLEALLAQAREKIASLMPELLKSQE